MGASSSCETALQEQQQPQPPALMTEWVFNTKKKYIIEEEFMSFSGKDFKVYDVTEQNQKRLVLVARGQV